MLQYCWHILAEPYQSCNGHQWTKFVVFPPGMSFQSMIHLTIFDISGVCVCVVTPWCFPRSIQRLLTHITKKPLTTHWLQERPWCESCVAEHTFCPLPSPSRLACLYQWFKESHSERNRQVAAIEGSTSRAFCLSFNEFSKSDGPALTGSTCMKMH